MTTTTTSTTATTRTNLRAEGFTCPSCVAKIEKQVGRVDGVDAVKVYFASSHIAIDHNPVIASVDKLVEAVAKAGYTARPAVF